jgi:ABC-type nitrate/sulfonate/bicarbonate transport system substrate-binding protein
MPLLCQRACGQRLIPMRLSTNWLYRLAAVVTAISVCGAVHAQSLDLKPLPKGETHTIKIGVGGVADTTHIAIWYAKYGGFLDKLKADGILVDVVPFGSGAEWLLAMTGGQVQMAHGYFENAVRAQSQGRDVITIFDVLPTPVFQVIVRKDLADKIKTLNDAAGAVWGFTAFGSASHVVSLRVAKQFGLEQSAVKWTPVGGTTGYLPSMREKRVDILTASVFAASQLIQEGDAVMRYDLADPAVVKEVYGQYLGPALLTSKEYLNKNMFVAYKVTEAIRDAIHAIHVKTPEEIGKVLPEQFQSSALTPSIAAMAKVLSEDGVTPIEAADKMISDMDDLKVSKGTLQGANIVDNRIAEALKASKPR